MFARVQTLKEIFMRFSSSLSHIYPEQEAKSITYWVLKETLGYSKAKIHASWSDLFPSSLSEQLDFILHELMQHKPIQYVFGKAYFMGLVVKVNEQTLIPRPETEELITWIAETCRENGIHQPDILDIGTGSGCIAVSLSKIIDKSKLKALDVSGGALAIASQNAISNEVEVVFELADVLSDNFGTNNPDKWDIIVSNPPYIGFSERDAMRKNVLDFEPDLALFVPDSSPLIFYHKIGAYAAKHLKPKGYLFFEINESYGVELVAWLETQGFKEVQLKQDFFGKDRMIRATLTN